MATKIYRIYPTQGKKHSQSVVIKARDLRESSDSKSPKIIPYEANELGAAKPPSGTLEEINANLKKLNELHDRFRFILKELEELLKC